MRGAAIALAAGAIFGCSEDTFEIEQPQGPESGYITLSLQCVEGTRAPGDYTEESKEELNENHISTVTLCLWAKGGDKPDDTAKPDYVQTFTGIDTWQTAEIRVPITTALRNKLFETSGAECHAFVAVNVDEEVKKLGDDFTIADLRNMAISSEFSSRRTQPSFAMDGDCVVSYDPALNLATGSIDLQRSASKITLALNVDQTIKQSVVINGVPVESNWKADLANMRVSLVAGLAESTLDPNLEDTPKEAAFFDTPDDLVYKFADTNTDNGNNPPVVDQEGTKAAYPYIQERPFYTYPHRWSAEPGDYAATYMILSIPWRAVDADGNYIADAPWRTCYYQVPVIAADSDPLQLVRNVSYHVYLHVAMLGSFVPEEPLEIEQDLKYSAAPWGMVNMDVEIPDVRYLVVDQNDYTVNNETSITIPFYTSHETVVTDATMTFYRYNFDDAGDERAVTVSWAQNEASATRAGERVFTAIFNNDTKELTVSHDLVMYEAMDKDNKEVSFTDNDGPDVPASDPSRKPKTAAQWKEKVLDKIVYFRKQDPVAPVTDVNEYSRVEFKITLQHTDMKGTSNFKEEISITQFPGMYITAVPNYHGAANTTTYNFSGAEGNAFINGYNINRTGDNRPSKGIPLGWTSSIGLNSTFKNYNPNMYLVTVTTLPEGTKYKIGDPRSTNINNNLESSNHNYDPIDLIRRREGSGTIYGVFLNFNSVNEYLRVLLTNGINSPLSSIEDKKVWSSTRYHWYYWSLNSRWEDAPNKNEQFYLSNSDSGDVTVTGFSDAASIYPTNGASRNLSYYYPTLEDDDHKLMIAPKFRICSSYAGTTWILNRELARRRAAAYQELGYAAGRWRLPTFGEVEFIMELAAQYKIPRLFGTDNATWWYWCAQGLVCVPSKESGKPGVTLPNDPGFELPYVWGSRDCHRARFVYDEWYWGEADLPHSGTIGSADCVYTFTWGDKPFTTNN